MMDTEENAEPQCQERLKAPQPETSDSLEEGESAAGVVGMSPNSNTHLGPSTTYPKLEKSLQDHVTFNPSKPPQQNLEEAAENPETLKEKICASEKVLLRDLKHMRHRQVIHPVLQEVGLKLNLLDPTLAIDLRYLGVRLPIPPPGAAHTPAGGCSAFVSRTGKTTDMTRIKGWREKFTAPEVPSPLAPPNTEATAPAPEAAKRNLSAFCSDMLDEYLENEGKLLEQQSASSFSHPTMEPVAYELPTSSCSYVRTLDSVLQLKQQQQQPPATATTSQLISAFVPPSKRPKVTFKETKMVAKRKAPRYPRTPEQDMGQEPPLDLEQEQLSPFRRRRRRQRLKASTSGDVPDHLAPLESDSELLEHDGGAAGSDGVSGEPGMTRAMLKQQDLEDGVVWEGQPRTCITEQRASVALSSLFTLTGFERENPTVPIQLQLRPAPRCLNPSCRLGCVCSSLLYRARSTHCGRPGCMLGCSCLKQKVVLLKNLEPTSDSSPSHHGHGHKKRRRKRRMRMAYVLKEADSVSQPAEHVRTLWKRRDEEDRDSEPIFTPPPAVATLPSLPTHRVKQKTRSCCARVRGYSGTRKTGDQQQIRTVAVHQEKKRKEENKQRQQRLKMKRLKRQSAATSSGGDVGPTEAKELNLKPEPSPEEEPAPRPSKRLTVLTQCVWKDEAERSRVLKVLCQRMALNRLDSPFWVGRHLIRPAGSHVEGDSDSGNFCINYKIHVSAPANRKPARLLLTSQKKVNNADKCLKDVRGSHCQVEEEEVQPVEEMDMLEVQGHDGKSSNSSGKKVKLKQKKVGKAIVDVALPFLQGVSPAGFLSASPRQPGGSDRVIQVNGKSYPLAKIQLGLVGALHPANRLAAYLTGRVQSSRATVSPCESQSAAPASSVATATVATSSPPLPPPTASSLSGVVAPTPTLSLPLQSPQVLMLPVPSAPPPPVAGQKVQTLQYLRRPDGRLFQLVPVSQLTTVQLKQGPAGPASALGQTTVVSQLSAPTANPRMMLPSSAGEQPIVVQSGQAIPQQLVKILVSASNLPPLPIGKNTQPVRATGGPLGLQPIATPSLPKAPTTTTTTTTTSRPTPELASKLSDLDLICVDDDAASKAKAKPEIVNLLSDEETEEEDVNPEKKQWRQPKSQKEQTGRAKLDLLFQNLNQQLEPNESCSKADILNKAVQVIKDLNTTDSNLSETVARLIEERECLLDSLVPSTTNTGSEEGCVVDKQGVLDGDSSSREREEGSNISLQQEELHSKHCTTPNTSDISSALGILAEVMDDHCSPPELLLEKARQEIATLQRESHRLKSFKIRLKHQRDSALRTISQHSGKSERSILNKLQLLSSKLGSLLARGRASSGGGASGLAHNKEPGRSLEAPLSPAVAPPTCRPVQQQQQQQSPATSQLALEAAPNRGRTVPNILSRSRKQALVPTEPFQVMAPQPLLAQQMVTVMLPGAVPSAGLTLIPSPLPVAGLTTQNVVQLVHPLVPTPQPLQKVAATAISALATATTASPATASQATAVPSTAEVVTGVGAAERATQPTPSTPPPPNSFTISAQAPPPPLNPLRPPTSPSAAGGASEQESLTSLLNEIALLSQGRGVQDNSPWLLQLDSDSDDPPVGVEEERVEGLKPGSSIGSCSDAVSSLAPPPLLQRSVAGAPAVVTTAATLTRRPMPRLVPLGLRGAPSS